MRYLIFFILLLTLATLACNSQNNDLPTLAPTPVQPKATTVSTAAPAVTGAPAATKPNVGTAVPTVSQPTTTRSANATAVQPVTSTPQADKGDDLDKLLDELNNALKNFDTMDDVK